MYKKLFPLFLLLAFLPSALYAGESIKCASTTSTRNSGLLEYLLPIFKADSGIDVQIIAVGTGAALKLGQRGDVDCVLVHAQDLEKQLVDEGYFVDREEVMYNDFVVLGPAKDPAGVKTTRTASEGFKNIFKAGSNFVSRGDNSGTNMRENRIWANTGKMPCRNDKWYLSTGQGMAKTIRIASEKQAYVLSDRGTWLSMQDKETLDLSIVLEGDSALFNQYGVMIVNPAMHSHVDYRLARNFVIWLTSPAGQQAIGAFKTDNGDILFTPNAR
jgi:tungstate transport system substrate-binding protein